MTRYELEIGRIVLHGFPPSMADGLGPLVEQRLAELVGDAQQPGARQADALSAAEPLPDQARLAGLVADRIWADVRQAGGPMAGGSS